MTETVRLKKRFLYRREGNLCRKKSRKNRRVTDSKRFKRKILLLCDFMVWFSL